MILLHILWLFKQKPTFPSHQHCLNPFLNYKDGEKALVSLQNRFLDRRNNLRHVFPSSLLGDHHAIDGVRLLAIPPLSHNGEWFAQ